MRIWNGDILIAYIERIEKVECIRNISQKTECKRIPNHPQRRRICIFCGRRFSNIIRKRLRIPRTHSETGTHRKEGISAESQGDREEFQPEETQDDAETQKDFWSIQGDIIYRIILNREFNYTCQKKSHSLFH